MAKKFLLVFFLLLTPTILQADIYKYIDKDGVEHYTTTPPHEPLKPSIIGDQQYSYPLDEINGWAILAASDAQRKLIQAALGDQYQVLEIAAVKSGNHRQAYYVGAVFHAMGAGDMIGIWLVSGERDAPGMVLSVNGAAHQFSGMRKASKTKSDARISDLEAIALNKYYNK